VKTESETSAEYRAFKSLLGRVLSVPHAEIMRREALHQKQAALNPKRRGPKPKQKPRPILTDSERESS
jgi:hypothetical protein